MKTKCLNGFWDFYPIYDETKCHSIPSKGWICEKYIVPSPWNKSLIAVRRKGEKYYSQLGNESNLFLKKTIGTLGEEAEFLFDGFGYPSEWTATRSAWIRKNFFIEKKSEKNRYFLRFDAVSPRYRLFINGQQAGEFYDPLLPYEIDATNFLKTGENQICILVLDHLRDKRGRTLAPSGNMFTNMLSGIWQDVYIIEKPEIYIDDIKIVTSVQNNKINVEIKINNTSDKSHDLKVEATVFEYRKKTKGQSVLKIPKQIISIDAGSKSIVEVSSKFPRSTQLWSHHNPALHILELNLYCDGKLMETVSERFGFREVQIEGKDIMLNGSPIHLFSDWGHKCSPFHLTKQWICKWFNMIKDCNMNHSRLHTHPHPRIFLDLADEMGILMTGETGIHGSGGAQGADSLEFWKNAELHIRRFVQRDKNHPSIILWSVENEMRWNRDESKLTFENLPKMKALFNLLDPSRPAYHEGDSSLWDESAQEIISRHYGKECSGIGWWNKTKPLHSGEMCLYHYAGPNNTLHLGGDKVFANYNEIDKAAAVDTKLIVEAGRANGIACFGPWNISCHQNLRKNTEKISINYEKLETPGVKPTQVLPYSSEFEFWRKGKGYYPNKSFKTQKDSFRPFALIDTNLKSAIFANSTFKRTITIINDTERDIKGLLKIEFSDAKKNVFTIKKEITVHKGYSEDVEIKEKLPALKNQQTFLYKAVFIEKGKILDSWSRKIKICPHSYEDKNFVQINEAVAVVGTGSLKEIIYRLCSNAKYFDNIEEAASSERKIMLIEKNAITDTVSARKILKKFTISGGRAVILEQMSSIFPQIPIQPKAVLKAFKRAYGHPVLKNIYENDLFMWGDDSFANPASTSALADNLYKKFDEKYNLSLIDSGEGGFGDGDLEYSALLESKPANGLVLACQLKLTDKIATVPAAEQLFVNMLRYAESFTATKHKNTVLFFSSIKENLANFADDVSNGATLFVENADESDIKLINNVFNSELQIIQDNDQFQAVRIVDDSLVSGISNWDTSGIELFCYSDKKRCGNFRIGSKFIAPTKKLKAILTTPVKSALKELFVYGGKSELLRSHTVSKFIYSKESKQDPLIVLGILKKGKGKIVLLQFNPEKNEKPRMKRLKHRLLANLGLPESDSTIFDGEEICSEKISNGFPVKIKIINRKFERGEIEKMLTATVQSRERLPSTAMFLIKGWLEQSDNDGIWRAEQLDLQKDIFIYHHIYSPSARKNSGSNLGVPNPEDLTFLDISGEGEVEITINGKTYPKISLENDCKTLADIELEIYYNHFLAKWTPRSKNSTLKFRWRNIMRKPEFSLGF